MRDPQLPPENVRPSEAQLRRMLEAREHQRELERKRMSSKLSKILGAAAAMLIGAILCVPSSREMIGMSVKESPEAAAAKVAIASLQKQNAANRAVPDDLKPFSIQPEADSRHEDLRFATELLNFLRPPARGEATPHGPTADSRVPAKSP